MPAQWIRPHGARSAGPNAVRAPGGAMPTGPPPLHISLSQRWNAVIRGAAALSPNSLVNDSSPAARTSSADAPSSLRMFAWFMKPIRMPRDPSGGLLSKVASMAPLSATACPVRPSARQNGVS